MRSHVGKAFEDTEEPLPREAKKLLDIVYYVNI
jgi:hypothetical protein